MKDVPIPIFKHEIAQIIYDRILNLSKEKLEDRGFTERLEENFHLLHIIMNEGGKASGGPTRV